MQDKTKDEECRRRYEAMLPHLSDYIDLHAMERPGELAIIEHDTGDEVTWKNLATSTRAFAAKLLDMGIGKGDVVATTLPLLKEHVYLMYACYRIGAIIAPLDLRLKEREIDRCLAQVKPKAYFFLGKTEVMDFRPMIAGVMDNHPYIEHWIQFDVFPHLIIEGATSVREFGEGVKQAFIGSLLTGRVRDAMVQVDKRDPCLIIFTTGSTGYPKPALICHENVTIQNIGIAVAFDITSKDRMCVNLPPSHVGCVTEQLATTIHAGGTSVILHVFDAEKTLQAIEQYGVTAFGQIPALFAMQWRLPTYGRYDLSSLRFALYGGQAVTREFLEKLATMAPRFGTGLGLTETAGFVTYTPVDGTVDDILASVGFDMPLCPVSIREPMKEDGHAGAEKAPGDTGEICFWGPQVFLGYLNDEANTKKTISRDGFCYTGDLGFHDEKGLHFAGRSKFVIKPKGYQVYPTEIEEHVAGKFKDRVAGVAVVGIPHEVFTEGIMAFVEVEEGASVTVQELQSACKDMAAYKRPSHFEVVVPGTIPLNRVAKTDYLALKKEAIAIATSLRQAGTWDA